MSVIVVNAGFESGIVKTLTCYVAALSVMMANANHVQNNRCRALAARNLQQGILKNRSDYSGWPVRGICHRWLERRRRC